jgi:hypothetical protein
VAGPKGPQAEETGAAPESESAAGWRPDAHFARGGSGTAEDGADR